MSKCKNAGFVTAKMQCASGRLSEKDYLTNGQEDRQNAVFAECSSGTAVPAMAGLPVDPTLRIDRLVTLDSEESGAHLTQE